MATLRRALWIPGGGALSHRLKELAVAENELRAQLGLPQLETHSGLRNPGRWPLWIAGGFGAILVVVIGWALSAR